MQLACTSAASTSTWFSSDCACMMTHSARSLHILGTSVPLSQAAVILFVLLALYICRVVFRSKADVGPTSALMNPALEGEITKLPTAWGDIYIRVFDPVKGGYSTSETTTSAPLPVVCLPGINAKLVIACPFVEYQSCVLFLLRKWPPLVLSCVYT